MCAAATAAVLLAPGTAMAGIDPKGGGVGGTRGFLTEARITGTGDGLTTAGGIAPSGFDPLDQRYPATRPADDTAHSGWAGLIRVEDSAGNTALTYCIDLETDTQIGVNYELGEWDESNVPNLGYVEHILLNYYPAVADQPQAANNNLRAAAVQAAIWYFTDKFVLNTDSTYRALTEQIVNDALAAGPRPEPEEPRIEVTPDTMDVPSTGEIVGPFRVTGNVSGTLKATGVEVFTDREGRNRLENGDEVEPRTTLWARSVSAVSSQGFVIERTTEIRTGAVFLYDGTNPPLTQAQKLILARDQEFVVRGGAQLTRFDAGALRITKTIAGEGAGRQGRVVVQVACVDQVDDRDRTFEARFRRGLDAGSYTRTFRGIPAGSVCTISETTNGANPVVTAVVQISDEEVTIAEGETEEVTVRDTYRRATGDLEVVKKIAGPGAGRQGQIVLDLDCEGTTFDRRFTIAAGTVAGTYPQSAVTGIPALTRCRVRELASGGNGSVEPLGPPLIRPRALQIRKGINRITVENRFVRRGHHRDRDDWFDRVAFKHFVFGHHKSRHHVRYERPHFKHFKHSKYAKHVKHGRVKHKRHGQKKVGIRLFEKRPL
ncbi:hypothetical protein GCM10022221_33130 [Actinocorallia aurea]